MSVRERHDRASKISSREAGFGLGVTTDPDEDDPTHVTGRFRGVSSVLPPVSQRRPVPPPPALAAPAVAQERPVLPALPAVTSLCEGTLISGQYVVERVVGSMGACVLVKVRHARLGQRYLLKYLSPEASGKPGAIKLFLAGARASMKLCSEHTARTVSAGYLESGLPYVVTEAFQGSELREVLRVRGALTLQDAIDFVLQAAEAIAEAHHHGLVHGSLSPSTLFVTRRSDGLPSVKVLEFGSSGALRSDPLAMKLHDWQRGTALFWESSRLWDTLAFSAPEQLRGLSGPTPLSDVWALGATLHELLSGSPPFAEKTATALVAAVVADAPAPLTTLCSGLSRTLEDVVLRCLAKEPSERFPSVADLAAALRPFATAETRLAVDRILRIHRLDARQSALSGPSRAIAREGPSGPARPTVARQAWATFAPSGRLRLIGATLLIGFGVFVGTVAGGFVGRSALSHAEGPRRLPPAAHAVPKPSSVTRAR